jgi:hypothetical protein
MSCETEVQSRASEAQQLFCFEQCLQNRTIYLYMYLLSNAVGSSGYVASNVMVTVNNEMSGGGGGGLAWPNLKWNAILKCIWR